MLQHALIRGLKILSHPQNTRLVEPGRAGERGRHDEAVDGRHCGGGQHGSATPCGRHRPAVDGGVLADDEARGELAARSQFTTRAALPGPILLTQVYQPAPMPLMRSARWRCVRMSAA